MAKRLNLSFSPLFLIFGFLVIYFGFVVEFFVYVVVMFLHEGAHYVCAKCFGYRLNKILFMPYGAGISGDSEVFLPAHEIVIALAGPLFNLFLVFLTIVFWWLMPLTYAYTQEFFKANLVLGMFNLLPIFPLDGGRVFLALFAQKKSASKST